MLQQPYNLVLSGRNRTLLLIAREQVTFVQIVDIAHIVVEKVIIITFLIIRVILTTLVTLFILITHITHIILLFTQKILLLVVIRDSLSMLRIGPICLCWHTHIYNGIIYQDCPYCNCGYYAPTKDYDIGKLPNFKGKRKYYEDEE